MRFFFKQSEQFSKYHGPFSTIEFSFGYQRKKQILIVLVSVVPVVVEVVSSCAQILLNVVPLSSAYIASLEKKLGIPPRSKKEDDEDDEHDHKTKKKWVEHH